MNVIVAPRAEGGLRLSLVLQGQGSEGPARFDGDVPQVPGRTPEVSTAVVAAAGAAVGALLQRGVDDEGGVGLLLDAVEGVPASAGWAAFCAGLAAVAARCGWSQTSLLAAHLNTRAATTLRTALLLPDGADLDLHSAAVHGSIKLKVRPGLDSSQQVRALSALPALQQRWDGNRSLSVADVDALLQCSAVLPAFIEEPTSQAFWAAACACCRAAGVAVALDESLLELDDDAALHSGAQVFVCKPGALGPRRTLTLASRARAAGLQVVVSGLYEGAPGLHTLAALHAAIGDGDAGLGTARFVNDGIGLFSAAGWWVKALP